METPEELAPQVVAVIVTCDPGGWFEEELAAFGAQDYPELSVLVLDCGLEDVTARVAEALPAAYVRRLPHNQGFGASANAVLEMVQGASHFVFCHDDVAPDPDVVGILVEESFRSNAGVVSPKVVSWDDPRRLLHVGMAVDKGGAVVDRVEPGEIDHGQHDSVRDVFLAPGGCTLIRADLFEELGGFDPQIFAMGEDLDFCWRAQVAGARVVVAPEARVRHMQLLASGRRGLPEDVRHAVPRSSESASAGGQNFEARVWRAGESAGGSSAETGEPIAAEAGAPLGAGPAPAVAAGSAPGAVEDSRARRRRALHMRRTRTRTELVTLQSLQRRHELRAVLKDYGLFHRLRVVPQLAFLSFAEVLIAWLTGHRERAAAVIHAWRWNATERSTLRAARAAVRATRRLDDSSVRRLQLHGSARLTAYIRRAVLYGMRAARLGRIEEVEEGPEGAVGAAGAAGAVGAASRTQRESQASVAFQTSGAFEGSEISEDEQVWQAEHAAARALLGLEAGVTGVGVAGTVSAAVAAADTAGLEKGPGPTGPELEDEVERRRMARATRSARSIVWVLVAVVLLFGSRQLLGSGFPYVGELLPFPSWSSLVHHFLSGWQPTGVGTTNAASPGDGFLGLGGLVLFGGVGFLQKIVVLGCIPLGALGMSRLVGGFGSVRGRVASAVAYLVVPLPYDALATGHWDALLAYGLCPWIVARLARAAGGVADGHAADGTEVPTGHGLNAGHVLEAHSARGGHGAHGAHAAQPNGPVSRTARRSNAFVLLPAHGGSMKRVPPRWRTTLLGRALALGVLEALLTSLAPSGAVLTLAMTAALVLGTLIVGGRGSRRAAARIAGVGVGATVVTVVLLAPWSVSVLAGPQRWQALTGLASTATSGASWGSLLHLGIGPIGDTPLAWGFVIAAGLPLLIGTGPRLAWAGRAWVLAGGAWLLAWSGARGWLGAMSVPVEVMLVPAAIGIAMAIGLGVAAFEKDLPGYRFGWRQAAAGLAALVGVVGTLPLLAATTSGRWDMPTNGYGQATSWMARETKGNFRVLWLGDPEVLPGGAWQLSPGLAYTLSENGLPDATSLWPGSSPGPASEVADVVRLAESAKTIRAGQLLAPYAVRYVVVISTLGPATPGTTTVSRPLPAELLPGLSSQIDLRQVISESGFQVFVDDAALPERALLPAAVSPGASGASTPSATTPAAPAGLTGWLPVLPSSPGSTHVTGRVGAGTLFDAVAPFRAWQMVGPTVGTKQAHLQFGFGSSFELSQPATVTVRFTGSWRHGLAIAAEILLWVIVLVALVGRRRWFDRWFGPSREGRGRDRHHRRLRGAMADGSEERAHARELVRHSPSGSSASSASYEGTR